MGDGHKFVLYLYWIFCSYILTSMGSHVRCDVQIVMCNDQKPLLSFSCSRTGSRDVQSRALISRPPLECVDKFCAWEEPPTSECAGWKLTLSEPTNAVHR